MSARFDLDWLRLRESADRRARSRALGRRFGAALRHRAGRAPARIVDLGAGSGANFRALAPLIPGDQEWHLVDNDAALLAAQAAEIAQWGRTHGYRVAHGRGIATLAGESGEWRALSFGGDIAQGLAALPLAGAHGLTCSALLDLVSAPWLEGLLARIGAAGLPFLAALTTDGRRAWTPAHAADAALAAAFARDHQSDKGFGPALGGGAPAALESALRRRGYGVESARSDWALGQDDAALLDLLAAGEAAVGVAAGIDAAAVAAWRQERTAAAAAAGGLRLAVGHLDILGLPPDAAPRPK